MELKSIEFQIFEDDGLKTRKMSLTFEKVYSIWLANGQRKYGKKTKTKAWTTVRGISIDIITAVVLNNVKIIIF